MQMPRLAAASLCVVLASLLQACAPGRHVVCGVASPSDRSAPGAGRGADCAVNGRDPAVAGSASLLLANDLKRDVRDEIAARDGPVTTGSIAPPSGASGGGYFPARRVLKTLSLPSAVALALSTHPRIGAQYAAVRAAGADQNRANGAFYPAVTVSAGAGPNHLGNWSGLPHLFDSGTTEEAIRSDVGFTLRQMVFDWGAARAESARTQSVALSERLRLADEAEKIALDTANAYLKMMEQRQVLGLVDQTLGEYERLSGLVAASQKDGNSTLADVQRIRSRIIEVRAMRTDIDTEMRWAENEFRRLTAVEVKALTAPRDVPVPASFDLAMRAAVDGNPGLLASGEATRAYGAQRDAMIASQRPRVDVQGDGLLKNYHSDAARSDVDMRAMVMVSYKLLDGGVAKAQTDRADADLEKSKYKLQDDREQVELDLRRAYQARFAAGQKVASIATGVNSAASVKQLYLEQFRNGKKSVFEVIDGYMSYFTMRRQQVTSQYDRLRADYQILRSTGRLTETLSGQI